MNKDFKQTSRSGSLAWLLQRISAVILFILLMLHFVTYHFLGKGKAVSYHWVMSKVGNWWFPLLQFVFLLTALYHGLNGVWSVLEDYTDEQVLAPGLVQPAAHGGHRPAVRRQPDHRQALHPAGRVKE